MSGSIDDGMLETFITGFSQNASGCRRTCYCGKEFFDGSDNAWSWEHGELEHLRKINATELPYSVESIQLEGREYVIDCSCWKARGIQIKNWIDQNAQQIARYLSEEKKRKQREADNSPVV